MRAGQLRHRVEIQAPVASAAAAGSYGGAAPAWVLVAYCWAAVEPLSGRRLEAAMQRHAEVTHQVTVRHRDDLSPNMRFVHAGRHLEILAILNPQERNRELRVLCKEWLA